MKLCLLFCLVPCLALQASANVVEVQRRISVTNEVKEGQSVVTDQDFNTFLKYFANTITFELMNCITANDFVALAKIVSDPTKVITESDWRFVIEQLYERPQFGLKSVTKAGLEMPFGQKKVLYYLTMIKFFQGKQADKTSELIKSLIGVKWHPKFDALVDTEPAVAVLKFENDIIDNIKASLVNVLLGKEKLFDSGFYQVDWSLIVQAQLDRSAESVLPIQAIFNATVAEHFSQIKLDALIDQIQNIAIDTDASRVKKILLYGAMIYASNEAILQKQVVLHYFKLVISWKSFCKSHLPSIGHAFFSKYSNGLEDSLHTCAKSVLNAPADKDFYIKSHNNYDELLYCQPPTYPPGKTEWSKMPSVFKKETYMPAHIWIPCSSKAISKAWYKWSIKHEGDRFFIESRNPEAPHRILDASYYYVTHCAETNNARDPKFAFRFVPSTRDDESCYIQHYESGRVIFAVATRWIEDEDRRQVSAEGNFESNGGLWTFPDMKFDS